MAVTGDYIQQLLALINDPNQPNYQIQVNLQPAVSDIVKWQAYRSRDKARLMSYHTPAWDTTRGYIADSLPGRMSIAFADFQFGDDPIIAPANDADRQVQKDLLQANELTSRLRKAADICVTEREVWWRIYTNPEESGWPILKFTSRLNVIPYYIGDRLAAVAFITEYAPQKEGDPTYRHLECYEDGIVQNFLYSTTDVSKLGIQQQLSSYPATANIQDTWSHELPMLAGVVKNGEDDPTSIFEGVEDFILALNEAHTIDRENFRLAGKKRAVMDKRYADQAGAADSGEEIYWVENDMEIGGGDTPLKILEYTYNADDSIKRKDDLERVILTRVGLAQQLVDANANEGLAQTGTALKTRLLPTTQALKGVSKDWQDKLPNIAMLLARVDALPTSNSGFARTWAAPDILPSITIASPLPADETEEANRHSVLLNAELESIETAIEEMRPGWNAQRRMLEVRRILANRAGYALDDQGNPVTVAPAAPPAAPGTGGGTIGEEDEVVEPPGTPQPGTEPVVKPPAGA